MGVEGGNTLQHKKAIYNEPIANVILNGEKLRAFPLRLGTRQRYLLLPLLFKTVLEILVIAIRQERGIKGIQIGKKQVNLSLFTDDKILYIENSDSNKKLLELMNSVELQDTKPMYRNWLHFYTLIIKQQKEKLRKQSHLQLHQKQ